MEKEILRFESGCVSRIGHYFEGVKQGQWVSFFESGIVEWIGNYIDGYEAGIWMEWYEDGRKKEECFYEGNEKRAMNFWDEKGKQTLKDGNGYTIEKFGTHDYDIYKHYFKDGFFQYEEKISGVVFGKDTIPRSV